MAGNRVIKSTKDIAIIAIMTTILFVQEQLLSGLPGIQLSVFLIILYAKKFGLAKASLIVFLHVLLDNFYMSSFSLMYTPTMFLGDEFEMGIPRGGYPAFKKWIIERGGKTKGLF